MRLFKRKKPRPFELEFTPHKGIGPINLGATQREALQAMQNAGMPDVHINDLGQARAIENSVEVTFDDNGRADFIGIYAHPSIRLLFNDSDLFGMAAQDVFHLFKQIDETHDIVFDENDVLFPNLIVTLWGAANNRHGRNKSSWAQIGLGNNGYKTAVSEIDQNDIDEVLTRFGISAGP